MVRLELDDEQAYCRSVPGWWPRRRPWVQEG